MFLRTKPLIRKLENGESRKAPQNFEKVREASGFNMNLPGIVLYRKERKVMIFRHSENKRFALDILILIIFYKFVYIIDILFDFVENTLMKTIKPYLHKINYYETDKMGITHHSNYIRFMEEARVDFLDQLGWSFIKLEEEGMASPVMSVEGLFKKSTTFPDTIEIMVGIEKLSAAKLTFSY